MIHRQRAFRLTYLGGMILLLLTTLGGSWSLGQAAGLSEIFRPGGWAKSASNPVVKPGTAGAWDDQVVFSPAITWDGSAYQMWYAGSSAADTTRHLGFATSSDGVTWTRSGSNPVLTAGAAGSLDEHGVSFPSVLTTSGQYDLWYTGLSGANTSSILYATSTNGTTWQKYAGNPVLATGTTGSWDATYVGQASVIQTGSSYQMWYRGSNGSVGGIGYATSPDGVTWTKYAQNPVVSDGSGSWDTTAYHPEVIFDGAYYHMWYSGCNSGNTQCQVGYATSSNGINWTRKGMVLPQGASGAFDDESADRAGVLLVGNTLKMWYSGLHQNVYQIGFASAPVTFLDKKVFVPAILKDYFPPQPVSLNVPVYQQECDQWCWSGVSQMILAYYQKTVTQCAIANFAWNRTDCCPSTTSCSSSNCNNWNYMYGTTGSLQGILTHWGVSSTALGNYLSYADVKSQVNLKEPIVIRFGWYYGGGHFLIIRGYNDNGKFISYNDPWDGESKIATYDWVVHSDYDHDWTHTLNNVKP